ncbi:MAG: sugar porter family MFS transporter [Kiritimatiellae bacterium]|nr:sugar porter family MFS transporter [Kiritimatiellia bacterium]
MAKSWKNSTVLYLLSMAGLGGLLYGVDFGVIAAAEPYLKALGIYSGARVSLIVGAVLVGGLLSSITAGMLCDWLGRRKTIILSAGMFLAAIPVVCLALDNFPLLYAGRVLQGMSAGYMAVAMPMYLTETLPAEIRGRGTGVFQTCLGIGLVVAAAAGCIIASCLGAADTLSSDAAKMVSAWRANFWWTLVPVAVLFVGSFRLKESPVWEERRKARTAAATVDDRSEGGSLFQRRYVVPFLLACLVLTLNKTTGMSSFTSYLVSILHKAGFSGILANYGQLIVKFTNIFMTVVAAMLIDRKGRTWLLKLGTGGMAVGLFAIGGVFFAIERCGVTAGYLTGLVTLVLFFFMYCFYAIGPGICVWLVLSELMPKRIRANGMAIALFMNQLVACGLASTFRPWVEHWGWDSMFFFFAINAVLYFVVSCFIPETKGKSLEELDSLFDRKVNTTNMNLKGKQ